MFIVNCDFGHQNEVLISSVVHVQSVIHATVHSNIEQRIIFWMVVVLRALDFRAKFLYSETSKTPKPLIMQLHIILDVAVEALKVHLLGDEDFELILLPVVKVQIHLKENTIITILLLHVDNFLKVGATIDLIEGASIILPELLQVVSNQFYFTLFGRFFICDLIFVLLIQAKSIVVDDLALPENGIQ